MAITHARGALSEMVAAAQLIKQGWHVFHNLNSNGLIDLVAVNARLGKLVSSMLKQNRIVRMVLSFIG